MTKARLFISVVAISLLTILGGGCVPGPSPALSPTPSPTLTGALKLYVTDAPPRDEVTSIMVTVSEVQVHKAQAEQEREVEQQQSGTGNQTREREQEQQRTQQGEGEWITIDLGDDTTFDLLEIRGIEQYLGASAVEATKYTQVRLVVDAIQVRLGNGELQDARVPSNELKIVHPFDIIAGETTAMVLDFDADKMVTVTGNGDIIVKPVVKLTVKKEKPQKEPEEQALVEVSCDNFTSVNHISKAVQVNAGDSFKIALCSNQTTGFKWSESAQIDDHTIIEQIEHKYIPPKNKQVVGAAGQEVWAFKALKAGTTNISMEYSQPWEGGIKAEWTFQLTVTVE